MKYCLNDLKEQIVRNMQNIKSLFSYEFQKNLFTKPTTIYLHQKNASCHQMLILKPFTQLNSIFHELCTKRASLKTHMQLELKI